jgi:hypothetical protein
MLHSLPEIDPDALLSRDETARELTARGFQTSPATLATRAVRGGGPPFQFYGRYVRYRWGTSLYWAKSRLTKPVHSTSELPTSKKPTEP